MTIVTLKAKAQPRKRGEMNRTEAQYAWHLDGLKHAGEIVKWRFESITLRLGKDCRFTPDFEVLCPDGCHPLAHGTGCMPRVELHEVKAGNRKTGKPLMRDDALVKIRVAAEMYPEFRFVMVWQVRPGVWERREF